MSLSPNELVERLESEVIIYAPEGSRFRLRRFMVEQVLASEMRSPADLMHRTELHGPDDNDAMWLATWDGEVIEEDNPNIPARWTELAKLALRGYIDWENWVGQNIES